MLQLVGLAAIFSIVILAIKWANRTDIPKIKGLPGVPIFGSLFLLGKHHARNCAQLAQKYGDVFQVRLGNRVTGATSSIHLLTTTENHLCELFRISQGTLDSQSSRLGVASTILDFSQRRVRDLRRLHAGHVAME